MTKSTLLAIVLALVALGTAVFYNPVHQAVQTLGAAGQDFSNRVFFHDNAIIGGFDYATSSVGASTYSATPFANAKVIEQQAASALTVTLPTGANLSSIGYLQYPGDTDTKYIHASTTKITLAGSTGVTLLTASSTKDISANSTGILTCARLGATEGRLIQCLLVAD